MDLTSILHSRTPLVPGAECEANLGPALPFPPMRVRKVHWSWALNLVCGVAMSFQVGCSLTRF